MIDQHDARQPDEALRCLLAEWRVGRRVPRNVYAQFSGDPDNSILIGSFDTAQLARDAVHHHNQAVRGRRR